MQPPFKLKRPKVKPVHLANGVFVARQNGFLQLKRLNRVVMHQLKVQKSGLHKGRVHPDDPYTSEKVFEELRQAGVLTERLTREQFETVRRALHQFVANDQAAFHCYFPHRPFGNDYSVCDRRLVTMDSSHPTDGGLGAVVVNVLSNSVAGTSVLTAIDSALNQPSAIGDLAAPFLETEELTPRPTAPAEVEDLAELMRPQTEGLANLVSHLQGNFTPETQARLLVLGLSLWVLVATLRWSERACNTPSPRLLLADFSQRPRRPLRRSSWLSVVQARRQLGDYRTLCLTSNPPFGDPGNWGEMFDYLGKRCGLVQPRSDTSRGRRYIEPMPDTIRVLVMSCFRSGETLLPFLKLAQRLRQTWSIVVGAEPDDTERIREAGFGNLQEDEDLAANVSAFRERLEDLQLAIRLSDGEHRCAALPEDLP
jgi:hypothetical protein